MNEVVCKICKHKAKTHLYNMESDSEAIDCNYCGKYYLMHSLEIDIYQKEEENFYKVSSWIRMQNDEFDINPEIDDAKFKVILNMQDKKIKKKFDLLMKYMKNASSKKLEMDNIKIICWVKNDNELGILLNKGISLGYIEGLEVQKSAANTYIISINNPELTFDGLEYVENLNAPNINSKKVFAAFYFSDEIKEIFDTEVRKVVEECGLTYTRVSSLGTAHDTTIDDEIIAMIKSSKIVIADFTGQRNSVYFEAGYALGMQLPVIWTCSRNHIDSLSFDTRQYPHILWDTADDLRQQLINRIKTII